MNSNVSEPTQIGRTSNHSGADFRRCALQVNPRHYAENFRGSAIDGDPEKYAQTVVETASDLGISVLAITDHNCVDDVPEFERAAADFDITIFPGFEITSSEGIHILCIYAPSTDLQGLERNLGEFGIRQPGSSSELSNKTFGQILEAVREQGGVTVASHVSSANGLFTVLQGKPRIRAWQDTNLHAIQIPGPIDDLPIDIRRIATNKDPNYHRKRVASENLAVAIINAKDVAQPSDLRDLAATCWIKMSEVSIEGLRQAFLDPESRIRLNGDPKPDEHTELVRVGWTGGFLDGVVVDFNPNLNVLIGGRGAGKSTVIESLRYVLNLRPIGDDADEIHTTMIRRVLRSGTKISLKVRSYRPTQREFVIERTIPNPPVIRDESGQISNLTPQDIIPNVEVYGQHEIAELATRREKRTALLNRFVPDDGSVTRRKVDLLRELANTRRSLIDVDDEIRQIDEMMSTLPVLEETLKRFQEAGLEDRLQERSMLVREERVLESVPERIQIFRDHLESLKQELPIDRAFLSDVALGELPGKNILADAGRILIRLETDLQIITKMFESAIERAIENVADVRLRWNERESDVQDRYQKILRELQKSAVDAEEFIELRKKIERLRPIRERRPLLAQIRSEHSDRRKRLLAEWEDIKATQFRALDRTAKKISMKLRDRVKIEVGTSGDRDRLFELLRDEIGGRLSEAFEKIGQKTDFSLREFSEVCRRGPQQIQSAYSIPPAQAERIASLSTDVLMKIEELELPSTTEISLNTGSFGAPPVWQKLDDLSAGQKATSILLLLLLDSDAPLVIDQPEDDLDNRFITEGVVPRMRDEKRRRQFVFSTHNANIPVLGDAELILGLTAKGDAESGHATIQQEHCGSIDDRAVRELVEDVLEGGKYAFETRRLKYGF